MMKMRASKIRMTLIIITTLGGMAIPSLANTHKIRYTSATAIQSQTSAQSTEVTLIAKSNI